MNSEETAVASGVVFEGTPVLCTRRRWRRIQDRHKELRGKLHDVLTAATKPDEIYVDERQAIHALKKAKLGPSEYLVVILRRRGQVIFITTAYYTSDSRARRRYSRFRRLARY